MWIRCDTNPHSFLDSQFFFLIVLRYNSCDSDANHIGSRMKAMTRINQYPIVSLLIGAVCISFSPIFINLSHVGPDAAGFYRMLFGGIGLLVIIIIRKDPLIPEMSAIPYIALLAVLISIDFFLWHRSIYKIGPGLSTMLGNFQVFFTAVISAIFFGVPLTFRIILAMCGAMAGVAMITGVDLSILSGDYKMGLLLGMGTALFYSFFLVGLKKLMTVNTRLSSMGVMMGVSLSSALVLCLLNTVQGTSFVIPDAQTLWALLGVGLLGQVIGWVLISGAMKKVSAPVAGLVLLLQPALAFVWDVLIFGRSAFPHEIFGLVLILVGIYLGSVQKDRS